MYAAMLRGINVGGRNMVPMKELVAMFTKAGCSEVRNYIQSGNVVFSADATLAVRIAKTIERAVHERFGVRSPVIVRAAGDLRRVVQRNPFLARGEPAERLHVMFLADPPSATTVASLDRDRSPPDAFEVVGREVYLCLPNGMARTKLTNAWFDSKLATVSTARNWKTVLTLAEWTGA
jgi:uncharacterized protein (DUF1697 family)